MRRWGMASIGMVLLLTSCGVSKVKPVTNDFQCRVDMVYSGQEASALLVCSRDRCATLSFESPEALEGVEMIWDGERVMLRYGAMELAVENDRIPVGVAAKVIYQTLEHCRESTALPANGCLEGESAVGTYTVTFDTDNGFPLMLRCPALDLTVNFSDCVAE